MKETRSAFEAHNSMHGALDEHRMLPMHKIKPAPARKKPKSALLRFERSPIVQVIRSLRGAK